MLYRFTAIAGLLALSSPGVSYAALPAPAATPVPALRVIASVRSTPRCAEIVTHANSAIGTALNNDLVLQQTITRLRAVNLDDGNPIRRHNGLNALGDLAKTLTQQARAGDDEVKRLRALAAQSKDPKEQKDLKAFADALGGALWRQQKVARDLNGYLAAVDFQDMAGFTDGQQQANRAIFGVPDPMQQNPQDIQAAQQTANQRGRGGQIDTTTGLHALPALGHDPNHQTATQEAAAAATDFESRLPSITLDENSAAQLAPGAFAKC